MAKNNVALNKLTSIWNRTKGNKQIHTTNCSTKNLTHML